MSGSRLLWCVRSMYLPSSMRRHGISVKTQSRLKKIDLIRQMPMSKPILNCMNISAARPEIVVSELPEISVIELASALTTASRWSQVSRCSL